MDDARVITVVGAGLAGAEAAWQIARQGGIVRLLEMRPNVQTHVHQTDACAELVCSNSFRSDDYSQSAIGLLHQEMRLCQSLIMRAADAHKLPAGSALAVDRTGFADAVTRAITAHPNIHLQRQHITHLPLKTNALWIIATGPLTAPELAHSITTTTGHDHLAFFDAIAPVVFTDSIDFGQAWYQSRYDKGNGRDYINMPMDKAAYNAFIDALLQGEKTAFKDWEMNTPYFEGCLPIEVMAERGRETLRFGPLKPIGLTNPHTTTKPYAVVQLRQDNAGASLYNIVGFQTKLTWGAQRRIFRTIPGLEHAEFARLGGIHRNTFINSPMVLDEQLRLKVCPHVRFAGQITGVEGYVESAACGLIAGRLAYAQQQGGAAPLPPIDTALGALLAHITKNANPQSFQPMNINFGLFPPLQERHRSKRERAYAHSQRALASLTTSAFYTAGYAKESTP